MDINSSRKGEMLKVKSKILFISYTFPPVGGMRPLCAAYYINNLVKRGHTVDVLTVNPSSHHPIYSLDRSNHFLLPESVEIHRTYAGIISHLASVLYPLTRPSTNGHFQNGKIVKLGLQKLFYRWGRAFLIPDGTLDWLPFGLMLGNKLVNSRNYDLIFSLGGPVTAHFVAYYLSSRTKLPWVADIGDPWSFNPIQKNLPRWRQNLDMWLEGKGLKHINKLIVKTEETMLGYLKTFPFLNKDKFAIIGSGFDQEKYKKIQPEKSSTNKFRLVYTGIFYSTQTPKVFFDALSDFVKDYQDFEVIMAGNIEPQYHNYIREQKLSNWFSFLGHQSHDRVVALQKGADLLLLFEPMGGYQVSQKIYEYLAAKRAVLVVQYQDEDIASRIVRDKNRGVCVNYDRHEIYNVLRKLYLLWKENMLNSSFSLAETEEYKWENIVDKIEETLKEVVTSNSKK